MTETHRQAQGRERGEVELGASERYIGRKEWGTETGKNVGTQAQGEGEGGAGRGGKGRGAHGS